MNRDDINAIVKNILASYSEQDCIPVSPRGALPSLEDVKELLKRIEGLLFPTSIETVEEQVLHVATLLETLLEKSFQESKSPKIDAIVHAFLNNIPEIRRYLKQDAKAHFDGDPAAKSEEEVLLAYPGFKAITGHRIAHFFYTQDVPLLPRLMSEWIHRETGVDIHPGAQIGHHFCIDHGTGIVVGETAVIGNHVKLYQGVTLGALSIPKKGIMGKRHPTLDDHVTVYAGTTILGGDTIIGKHSIIGGNVWITSTIPPKSKVYIGSDKRQILKTEPLEISAFQGWGI
jgi:serine O-acetyltransferase